jgi:hypothetical protein
LDWVPNEQDKFEVKDVLEALIMARMDRAELDHPHPVYNPVYNLRDGELVEEQEVLLNLLMTNHFYTGEEIIDCSAERRAIGVDGQGNIHVRCKQFVNSNNKENEGLLEIEGASIVIHINGSNGTVFAVNGEFHPSSSIVREPQEEA